VFGKPEFFEMLDGAIRETWIEAQLGEASDSDFRAGPCASRGGLQSNVPIWMPVGDVEEFHPGVGVHEWQRGGRT
jgi:hypothetical protein